MGSVLNPVHRMAAQKGLVEIIRRYIEKGGDVNATDSRGCSLLYWARVGGNQELCALLVSVGAIEIDGKAIDPPNIATAVEGWPSQPEQEPESALFSVTSGDGGAPIHSAVAEEAGLDGWVAEDEFTDSSEVSRVREQRPEFAWIDGSLVTEQGGSLDEGDWVAEADGECLPSDEELAATVRAIQAKITSHFPVDDAAGWSEVTIQKPPIRKKKTADAISVAIDEDKVAALIAKVEADGCVSLAQIESIAPRISGEIDEVFMDVAKRLVAELGGLVEEFAPDEIFDKDELLFSSLKKQKLDELSDFISFFEERYRGEKDSLKAFSANIKKCSLLSPKEEIVAGKEISDCLNDAVRIISRSKILLQEFISGFSTPTVRSGSEEDNDTESIGDSENGRQEVSEGRESASFTLLGDITTAIEEAGDGEVSGQNSTQIEQDLLSFGFGFADAERLLRKSEINGKKFFAVRVLRGCVGKAVEKRNFLVERNLRLVGSVARRYSGNGCDLADLVQEGNVGLMKAAERWDYRLGYKFSTYAMWWIRQSITRAIQDSSRAIRIPVHVGEQIGVCKREMRKHAGMPERDILPIIADAVGMDLARVRKLLAFEHEIVSLDNEGLAIEDDALCTDVDVTESAAIEDDANRKIEAALSVLDERQRNVILMRFGIGDREDMTLEQVGREFGVTRERIRQLESKALLRLSKGREADILRELLGGVS